MGQLAKVRWLWLHDNRLTGPVPPELGQAALLAQLFLDGNPLTGPFPADLLNPRPGLEVRLPGRIETVEVTGPRFAAPGESVVFTVDALRPGTGLVFDWRVLTSGEFIAQGEELRFGFRPPIDGVYTVLIAVQDPEDHWSVGETVLTVLGDVYGSGFADEIVWLGNRGITNGCGDGLFCPDDTVTREQMAAFLARALHLPPAHDDHFDDDTGSVFEDDINRLAEARITEGCDRRMFCPRDAVTRGQMAAFLARALYLPSTSDDHFDDDTGSVFEDDINRLAESGITEGCAEDRFCPYATVTRGQMAAFLYRARSLIPANDR